MLTFTRFIEEKEKEIRNFDIEIELIKGHKPVIRVVPKHIRVSEGLDPNENEFLGEHLHDVLSKFSPSAWDHGTIATELYKHLNKHGYHSVSATHAQVFSPRELAYKAAVKRILTKGVVPKFETPHQDKPEGVQPGGKHVALWSTNNPTQIYKNRNPASQIPQASQPGRPTIVNDYRAFHSAPSNTDPNITDPHHLIRHFVRLGDIRRTADTGGHTIHRYIDGKLSHIETHANFDEHLKAKETPSHNNVSDTNKIRNKGTKEQKEALEKLHETFPEYSQENIREHHKKIKQSYKTAVNRLCSKGTCKSSPKPKSSPEEEVTGSVQKSPILRKKIIPIKKKTTGHMNF